jgi:hypothetical protein
MVERDDLENRGYAPTIPTDLDDPPQFGQPSETVKDAFVEELRQFLDHPLTSARRGEIPTVRKYAVGYGPGTDPYETTAKIVEDWADEDEALPHLAVTAFTGTARRMTVGQPFIDHVQLPPRIRATNAEPYALTASVFQVDDVVVNSAVVGQLYYIDLNGQGYEYTAQLGDTTQDIAQGLWAQLKNAQFAVKASVSGSTLTLTAVEVGVAFTVGVAANMSTVSVTAAAGPDGPDELHYRTTPDRINPATSIVRFHTDRFPTSNPPTAARAEDVARIFNEQSLYARARVVDIGGTPGVQFETGGKLGGGRTPNEIEVLSTSSANLVAALGIGDSGTAAIGDAVSGTPPDTYMMASIAGAGFTAAMEGRYFVLAGMPTAANNGRFLIRTVVDPNTLLYENPYGVAEALASPTYAATWFVGFRDDSTNPDRPVMNRRHMRWEGTINISVLAEDPNERTELADILLARFSYFLEEKYFELFGRGVFDEDYLEESWQVSIASEIQYAGTSDAPRPDDPKDRIYEGRLAVPCTLIMYQDRSVLVPYGPSAGQSWVLNADDVSERDRDIDNP